MFQTAIISFREGLEMFLIIAIILAWLSKSGQVGLKKPVYWGVAIAALVSLTTAWHVGELAEDPLWEGILALGAGVLVASMSWLMIRQASSIRQHIGRRLDKVASHNGIWAAFGLFIFTLFMIAREGMETAMMVATLSGYVTWADIISGMLIGFGAVLLIGYSWVKGSKNINIKLFMQVTGVFLLLFCGQLFIVGFHELTEAYAIPFIDNDYWHLVTEPFEPSEPVGQAISLGLFIIPALWIVLSQFKRVKTAAGA